MALIVQHVNLTSLLSMIVIFSAVNVCINDFSASSEGFNELDAMLQLLYLKDKNCSYVNWCTLSGTGETGSPYQCCAVCSCEDDCQETKSCCPDYGLYNMLGTRFDNISEIVTSAEELRNGSSSSRSLQRGIVLSEFEDTMDHNDYSHLECVHLQMMHGSPFRPIGISYRIVTNCTANNSEDVIRRLCENPSDIVNNETLVSRYTPVQSLASGQVYRNKYCFMCSSESNQDQLYTQFRAALSVNYLYRDIAYQAADEIFEYVFQVSQFTYTVANIIFTPKQGIETLDKKKVCTKVDVDFCSYQTSDTMTQACNRIPAPVSVRLKDGRGHYTTYNNIACLYCNNIQETDTECFGNTQEKISDYKIQMKLTETNESEIIYDKHLEIIFDSTGACSPGYALDRHKVTCRKVYCPKDYIISSGRCQPLFDDIKGVIYSVRLNLTFTQNSNRKRLQRECYSFVFNYTEAQKGVQIERRSMWTSRSKNTFFIILEFITTDEKFRTAETFVNRILKNEWFQSMKTKISLNANLEWQSKIKVLRELPSGSIFRSDEQKLILNAHNAFLITRSHFCYRLLLDQDDFFINGKSVYLNIDPPRLLIDKQYLLNDVTGLPLICLDEILPQFNNNDDFLPEDFNKDVNELDPKTSRLDDGTKVHELGYAAWVSFGVLFILVTVVCALRQRYIYSTRAATDMSAHDVRNVNQ